MERARAGEPGFGRVGVGRPRLDRRLLARRAFVVAGAGAGKSTLLARAAAVEPRSRMIHLTPGHATPTALAAELEAARAADVDVVLLDDAQWCAGGEAAGVLERFLLETHQRVVVASREPMPAAVPRAEYGGTATVGMRDLALRLDEVGGAFLASGAGHPPLEVASTLLAETAGWPALVGQVAGAVAGVDRDGLGAAVATVVVGDVAAPFLDAVLGDLEPALQQAIHAASVFAVLRPGPLTDLLGPVEAAMLLRALDDGVLAHRLRADGGRELPRMLRRHVLDRTTAVRRHALATTAASLVSIADGHRLLADAGLHEVLSARLRDDVGAVVAPGAARWAPSLRPDHDDPFLSIAAARALLDDRAPAAARLRLADLDGVPQPPAIAQAAARLRLEAERDLGAGGVIAGVEADDLQPPQRVRLAVDRLLAGDAVRAMRLLRLAVRDPGATPWARLAGRLAMLVAQSAIADPADTVAAVCQVEADAESAGLTGLARLSRGVLAALSEGGSRAVHEVVEECDARDDQFGGAVVEATALLARLRDGRADARRAGRLADRFAALGRVDAASFARCTAAYLSAAHGSPAAAAAIAGAASTRSVIRNEASLAWLDAARAQLGMPPEHELVARARRAALAAGMPRLPVGLPVGRGAHPKPRPASVGAAGWTPVGFGETAPLVAHPSRAASAPAASAAASPILTIERMPRITVGCFGGFRLAVDGRDLDLHGVRPQARNVLRILALNVGAPVHRELIAELIWGDLGTTSAMHALHVSISSLRRALGADTAERIVERAGEAYLLHLADRRDCDLADFDASLEGAADARRRGDAIGAADGLRHAVHRYVGEILPEDGPAEWAVGARERYRTRASEAASALAHLELRTGDRRGALDAATRAVEIDPWLDESWRALVTVHRESGDVVATRRAEEAYRRVRQTLGVE